MLDVFRGRPGPWTVKPSLSRAAVASTQCAAPGRKGEGLIRCSVPCSVKVLAKLKVGLARVGYDGSAMRLLSIAGLSYSLRHPASGIRHPASGIRHPEGGALGLTLVPDPFCDHDCGTWDPCRSLAATLSGSDSHVPVSITGEHAARSCGFRASRRVV